MRRGRLRYLLVILVFSVILGNIYSPCSMPVPVPGIEAKPYQALPLPFEKGEVLSFKVKIKGLTSGESVLVFHGLEEFEGKKFYHITFMTKTPVLRDTEEIYAFRESFLPAKVLRTVNQIGSFTSRIVEEYDQDKFTVSITKKGKLFTDKRVIRKKGPINNAILLSYYYRLKVKGDYKTPFKVILPTSEFEVLFKAKESVDTPRGKFEAYVFTSLPPKFELCVSAGKARLPLRIQTSGYALVLGADKTAQARDAE